MSDDRGRAGVGDDVADALRRMIGVERHIGRARLEQAEQRRIGLDPAVDEDGDAVSRLYANREEITRHLIRAPVELRIG